MPKSESIGQNDGGKIIGLSSSASFCPHHFARKLKGGCLARQIEAILRGVVWLPQQPPQA
jgi:hypothetical protein